MIKKITSSVCKVSLSLLILLFAQQLFAQQDGRFSPKATTLQPISLHQAFSESRSITPFSNSEKIYSLALSGAVEL